MFENEREDFKAWLASRQQHFDEQSISPDQIATLALEHGFPEAVVRQWQTSARFRWEGLL